MKSFFLDSKDGRKPLATQVLKALLPTGKSMGAYKIAVFSYEELKLSLYLPFLCHSSYVTIFFPLLPTDSEAPKLDPKKKEDEKKG